MATTSRDLVTTALPPIMRLAGATVGQVLRHDDVGTSVRAYSGLDLPPPEKLPGDDRRPRPACAVWRAAGIITVVSHPLPIAGSWLILGFGEQLPDRDRLETALATLDTGLLRLHAQDRLIDLTAHVDATQRMAGLGTYEWRIDTGAGTWSDQLFRMCGYEPGAFAPDYDQFLGLVHPEDRERTAAAHRKAAATGGSYETVERVVRPDGAVRYLATNGQADADGCGVPVRVRGTCVDVTDRMLAEQAREQAVERFRGLLEASSEAILVLDRVGRVVQGNGRAASLLGGDAVGRNIAATFPGTGIPRDGRLQSAIDLHGKSLSVDVTSARLGTAGDEEHVALFLAASEPRLASERVEASLRAAELRRRQALELNDNVVQGLSAALLSLSAGDAPGATTFVERTLGAARRMMNDWLDLLHGGGLKAGDLVRHLPSVIDGPVRRPLPRRPSPVPIAPEPRVPTVVVVDDNDDMRRLLSVQVRLSKRFDVVGEAADGEEAISVVGDLHPDVVLLDLSMPVMDGLQALPLIRQVSPGSRVIVMSGFDTDAAEEKALAAGAVRYLEKGTGIDLAEVFDTVLMSA